MVFELALAWLQGDHPAGSDRKQRQMISDIAVRLPELIYPFQNLEPAFEHLNQQIELEIEVAIMAVFCVMRLGVFDGIEHS